MHVDDEAKQDEDPLLHSSSTSSLVPIPRRYKYHGWSSFVLFMGVMLVGGVFGFILGFSVSTHKKPFPFDYVDADKFCIRHVNHYSPVVNEVDPNWHTVQYNGTFFHANAYRQPAGPEVDAAWIALGTDYRSVVIPESEAFWTGLRNDQVKVSQEYGGGFPANVEGLHHLHCLNLMRKALWWNYEYYREQKEGAFVNSEYVVRYHVTHCMDILRQQLMCVTDIGVLGQVWYQPEGEASPTPFVDFNTKHRCRDYEAIRKWAEEHQLPPETEVDMNRFYEQPKPEDTIYLEIP